MKQPKTDQICYKNWIKCQLLAIDAKITQQSCENERSKLLKSQKHLQDTLIELNASQTSKTVHIEFDFQELFEGFFNYLEAKIKSKSLINKNTTKLPLGRNPLTHIGVHLFGRWMNNRLHWNKTYYACYFQKKDWAMRAAWQSLNEQMNDKQQAHITALLHSICDVNIDIQSEAHSEYLNHEDTFTQYSHVDE
tara:strand:+ start:446 stop:1024 length:579 start_codon:yes stop_codon:yes gene_type:complete